MTSQTHIPAPVAGHPAPRYDGVRKTPAPPPGELMSLPISRSVRKRKSTMSIKEITNKLNEWRRYRASVRELSALTDRELTDLGIARADIQFVAKKCSRL